MLKTLLHVCLATEALHAQSITGTITDPSDASIPNARIVFNHVQTNETPEPAVPPRCTVPGHGRWKRIRQG